MSVAFMPTYISFHKGLEEQDDASMEQRAMNILMYFSIYILFAFISDF